MALFLVVLLKIFSAPILSLKAAWPNFRLLHFSANSIAEPPLGVLEDIERCQPPGGISHRPVAIFGGPVRPS